MNHCRIFNPVVYDFISFLIVFSSNQTNLRNWHFETDQFCVFARKEAYINIKSNIRNSKIREKDFAFTECMIQGVTVSSYDVLSLLIPETLYGLFERITQKNCVLFQTQIEKQPNISTNLLFRFPILHHFHHLFFLYFISLEKLLSNTIKI